MPGATGCYPEQCHPGKPVLSEAEAESKGKSKRPLSLVPCPPEQCHPEKPVLSEAEVESKGESKGYFTKTFFTTVFLSLIIFTI